MRTGTTPLPARHVPDLYQAYLASQQETEAQANDDSDVDQQIVYLNYDFGNTGHLMSTVEDLVARGFNVFIDKPEGSLKSDYRFDVLATTTTTI